MLTVLKMNFIQHRVNTLVALRELPAGVGAEIDLRSNNGEILLEHDPFKPGDSFKEYAALWVNGTQRGTLILNPKEDGLEGPALELMKKHGITDFFFLDLTLPTTVRFGVRQGLRQIAVRYSEYEPIEGALVFAGKVDWVWLDSFSQTPMPEEHLKILKKSFKTCLVSPELHGVSPVLIEKIEAFKSIAPYIDSVCTKRPDLWGFRG